MVKTLPTGRPQVSLPGLEAIAIQTGLIVRKSAGN